LKAESELIGKTCVQVTVNRCICRKNVIAIPKINSINRVKENCVASRWQLTARQIQLLKSSINGHGMMRRALRNIKRQVLIAVGLKKPLYETEL